MLGEGWLLQVRLGGLVLKEGVYGLIMILIVLESVGLAMIRIGVRCRLE